MAGRPKKATNNDVEEKVTKEEVKEEPKTKSKESKKEPRELLPTTMVSCMNNLTGGISYRPQFGGRGFRAEGYGKRIRIQLQDLENLYNEAPRTIDEGWIYILDEDVIEHMYLSDLYENLVSPRDVDNFIKLSEDEIRERLENAPRSMKVTMYNVLKKKIKDGDQELQYVPRQRFFEEVLGAKFNV